MELSSRYVLAVQQTPLLSHTYHLHNTRNRTHAVYSSLRLSSFLSWSQDQRGFEGTTVSGRLSTVIPAGCSIRGSSKDKWSCSGFTACDQRFDPTNPKGQEW